MESSAEFSPDRVYRYTLWRKSRKLYYDHVGYIQFIGLNPSTADEHRDDPTMRRCRHFMESWGYSQMCMTNLFAFRATNPEVMIAHDEPIGEKNDFWISGISVAAAMIICCWGNDGMHNNRGHDVRMMLEDFPIRDRIYHLGLTKSGQPRHPLYLKNTTQPQLWKI